ATTTEAKTGASGGGVSVAAAVAIAIDNVTSTADALTGLTLSPSGAASFSAATNATAATTASGDTTSSGSAAIGAAIALTFAKHTALATTQRIISAGGAVSFNALGASSSSSSATASAAGAPAEDSPDHPAGQTVDSQVADERGNADATAAANGAADSDAGTNPTPKAESSEKDGGGNNKPLQVAASIAITISIVSQQAQIRGGLAISSGGPLTLSAKGNTDSTAKADGKAVATGPATGTSVGAAIAANLAFTTTEASTASGAIINAGALTIESKTQTVGSDSTNTYGAEATSGAGGGKNSVAGSLAFNLVLVSSTARLGSASVVTLTGGTGDVTISADPDSTSTTKALAGETAGTTFGLGLSIAVSIVNDSTTAAIGDGVILTGAHDLAITAGGGHASIIEAANGAKATLSGAGAKGEADSSRSGKTADSDVSEQRDFGQKKAGDVGAGSTVGGAPATPKAESSEKDGSGNSKPLQVAAALAVTISVVSQRTALPAGLFISAGAAGLTLSAKGNTDSTAKASGKAVTTGP